MKWKYRRFALVATLTAGADLVTKAWAETALKPHEPFALIPGWLDLTLVRNPGVAFGLFSEGGGLRLPLILGVTVAALLMLLWLLHSAKPAHWWAPIGLGLVFGGALGNLADRVRYGEVVDFIDAHYKTHHWPAFNVADAAICVGIALLILGDVFLTRSQAETSE